MLFGSMALIMLTVIEPKFARRQERLERMQQSRQLGRANQLGRRADQPGEASKAAGGDAKSSPTRLWQPTHRANLRPLMLFLAAMLAGGIIVMQVRRRMAARCTNDRSDIGGPPP